MASKTRGSTSAQLLTALVEDNHTIFSVADAQQVLGSSYDATPKALRRLTRAGWLVRLMAGRYAIVPLPSRALNLKVLEEIDRVQTELILAPPPPLRVG